MNWLYNKTILITGASSGLGKQMVKIFITKYNCKVIGANRNEQKLKQFKLELNEYKDNFDYYVMDASVLQNWKDLYQKLLDAGISIDILINNAGLMHPFMKFDKLSYDSIYKVMNTNFYSAIYSTQTFLPMLLKSKTPAIINIASAAALVNVPGVSIYSASKSALRAFSETISYEYRDKIFVSTIMPGFAKTNLFYSSDNDRDVVAKTDDKLISKFCMDCDKMAKKIVKAISHKKHRVVLGKDARAGNFFNKLMPIGTTRIIGYLFKHSKLQTFDQIFNDTKENKNGDNN